MHSFIHYLSYWFIWGASREVSWLDTPGICALLWTPIQLLFSNSSLSPFSIFLLIPDCLCHLTYPLTYISLLCALLDYGGLIPDCDKARVWFIESPMTYCSLASADCLLFFGLNTAFAWRIRNLFQFLKSLFLTKCATE